MTAEAIAKALGGRRAGASWMARCPGHDDRTPSLAIGESDDGGVLIYCHAGCPQAHVIEVLRARGLWTEASQRLTPHRVRHATVPTRPALGDAQRIGAALSIWAAAGAANGTLVETYFASRGLRLRPPLRLRFHARLKHRSGSVWPAMVGLVTLGPDDAPLGVHRTYLARDGLAKAPVDPPKMMLGPCRGGAVRLATAGSVLLIGEGLETCLAAMQATGHPAWAALSTSGLRALHLPGDIADVILLADGDGPGEAAAQDCARRWKRQGRRVRIARPPRGMDFNDLLLASAAPSMEGGS